MDCRNCDIPDVACHEQCRTERCRGCFGASFGDCEMCEEREGNDVETEEEGD